MPGHTYETCGDTFRKVRHFQQTFLLGTNRHPQRYRTFAPPQLGAIYHSRLGEGMLADALAMEGVSRPC